MWGTDVLDGYERAPLGPATLIRPRSQPTAARTAVLHVHGYNDYFFHTHLADAVLAAGHAFYAVDLRRAGRSLRAGDVPHFMTDVAEQGDDIAAAVGAIASLRPGAAIVVHAHSTGGLSTVAWAADRPHPSLTALALDSPLFGARVTAAQRVGSKALPALSRLDPMWVVAHAPSMYSRRQHVSGGGRWDFDLTWKNPEGIPIRAGWADAVRRTQRRIVHGLALGVPTLVARAAESGPDRADNPRFDSQDTVLDVNAIARLGARLGPLARPLVIDGAVHDLTLSADRPREQYLESLLAWIASEAS